MSTFFTPLKATLYQLLYRRTILLLALLLCIGVTGALWNTSRFSSSLIRSHALQSAVMYAQAMKNARTLYSDAVVDRIDDVQSIRVTHDYALANNSIPLPATFLIELGQRIRQDNPEISVRLFSDYPFPWRKAEGGPKDDFEREALTALKQNSDRPFFRIESFQDKPIFRYAEADILQRSCINCHNTHPESPKRDWKVGDVRGVLEITQPLQDVAAHTEKGWQGMLAILAGFSGLSLVGITLVMGRLRQTAKELELQVLERTAQLRKTNENLAIEQEKSERLLLNILPRPIAEELKRSDGNSHIAREFAAVSILFADIVGFTNLSQQISAEELVKLLNEIFSKFDRLTDRYGLEKIKTIGDAYMAVGGIPNPRPDHAEAIADMALAMQHEIEIFNQEYDATLKIRIGINTGSVIAGVIGKKKFIYDLWGDAVNTASRMESHGIADSIQVTDATYQYLKDTFNFEDRGIIQVKGKGDMKTYLLVGRK
ncbi:MAG: adenylate/guanylate cyclase domain-containing protein [Geitlerinemataceae cyanobacterium]